MEEAEKPLEGGNASETVVRIATTVRKPWQPSTPAVQRFMAHLRDRGLGDVPQPLGRDSQGRQVIEFIPGAPAPHDRPLPDTALREIGQQIRKIHEAAATFKLSADDIWNTVIPVQHPDLICHNDLAPWNIITGQPPRIIDWDGSGPSTRLWDLAYAAQSCAFLVYGQDPIEAAARLRILAVEGYEADLELRAALPRAMSVRTQAMYDFLREAMRQNRQPWAQMFADGHGEHWAAATHFVRDNESLWAQALSG